MDVHVEIAAETLFHVGPVAVTNSMLTMFLVMGLILVTGWLIARNLKPIPDRKQGAAESIVEYLLNLVVASGGQRVGRRVFPLVAALFIFIIFSNYSGLLPGVGVFGYYESETEAEAEHRTSEGEGQENVDATEGGDAAPENTEEEHSEESSQLRVFDIAATGGAAAAVTSRAAEEGEEGHAVLIPFLRAPTADLNMTLALALVTFTVVQVAGIRAHGVVGRIKHMADPPFLFPIEAISELSRIISLSARLFGNIFAGEVLLGVMYAMGAALKVAIIPFFLPVLFLFLELMFGAIQALVFALLTLIYIALAAGDDHEEHEAHAHETAPTGVQTASAHGD